MELTSSLVEDTIELLEKNGWCKRAYENADGEHCAIGAFRVVRNELVNYSAAGEVVDLEFAYALDLEFAYALGFGSITGVLVWNDSNNIKKHQVIDRMTEAAKDLRNQGR